MDNILSEHFSKSSKIVVKIGSDLIVEDQASSSKVLVRKEWMRSIAKDILDLRASGKNVLIASSGAVALGGGKIQEVFNKTKAELTLPEKQAAAAFGQTLLMKEWRQAFAAHGKHEIISQHLLVRRNFEDYEQSRKVKATLDVVLAAKGIPVINENDTVATDEICYGDNDQLAARVGLLVGADSVVLLSKKIDGLYKNWGTAHAALISNIPFLTQNIWDLAKDTRTTNGSGGMTSKLKAAELLMAEGQGMIIARGDILNPLTTLQQKKVCSAFGLS